jgi:hypothetical protein
VSTPQDRAPGTADELTLTDRDVAACWHDAVDLGEVRYRHRDWPPSWWAWLVWLVLPAVVFLVPQPWWSNLAVYLVLVGFLGAFVLNGWSHQVLVRERAVVLT